MFVSHKQPLVTITEAAGKSVRICYDNKRLFSTHYTLCAVGGQGRHCQNFKFAKKSSLQYRELYILESSDLTARLNLGAQMVIDSISLENALRVLGELLEDRGYHFEVVAIGGGSLLLLKQLERTTKDLDLVALIENDQLVSADPLPQVLLQAAEEVGTALELGKGWLNNGPASLLDLELPSGFKGRLHTRHYNGLTIHLADRFDQICFKVYASVDQGPQSKHFTDLITLKPTSSELIDAKNWCTTHDVSESFEIEINQLIESMNEYT